MQCSRAGRIFTAQTDSSLAVRQIMLDRADEFVANSKSYMSKIVTEKERAFWRNEIHEWKIGGGNMSWARWCQARELKEDDMPRPLDAPLQPSNPTTQTSYDLKQERRRKRASNAMKRAARKEKRKEKEKALAAT